MKIKAIYENGVLKLREKLDLEEKEEVEIEILTSNVKKLGELSK